MLKLKQPLIPQADSVDGLLTLEALQQPIFIHLQAWGVFESGDSYQLTWNGTPLGEKKYLRDERPGDPLTLVIPAQLLEKDGAYDIGYVAKDEVGGQMSQSLESPLIIDRTPPGGDLLAPLLFEAHQQPLTEEALALAGDVLTARLPSYFDAKWGDVVRTYWGEQPGPERTLKADELGGSNIVFSFTRDFLEQLKDGEVFVTYTVTDRAGNLSRVSEPALLRLQLRNLPQALLAPVVPSATDSLLDHNDARHGVRVDIPRYGNVQPGDEVVLHWGKVTLHGQLLNDTSVLQPTILSWHLPYATVQAAGDGPVEVRYDVYRNGVLGGTSPAAQVNVFVTLPGPRDPTPATLINEQLAAPTVRGRSEQANREHNVLDEDDYRLDADVIVPWQTGFKAFDQVALFWGTWPLPVIHTLDQNDIDAGADLVICLPNKLIVGEGPGRAIPLHYTVTRTDNPNTSHSPTQLVRVVSQAQLPGGECGLAGAVFVDADTNHTLRLPAVTQGTSLWVKPYRNLSVGDLIEVSLKGYDAFIDGQLIEATEMKMSATVDEHTHLNDVLFKIPSTLLDHFTVRRIEARYQTKNDYGSAWSLKSDVYIDRRSATPQPVKPD
jgi:hypothetical protein